jgi:hypothetical protein
VSRRRKELLEEEQRRCEAERRAAAQDLPFARAPLTDREMRMDEVD